MNIIAIETSASACSIGLLIDDKEFSYHENQPMKQSQIILPLIDKILSEQKIKLTQLDAIAFGCGPGSFTGVRIAASVAQALAFSKSIPVIKISSLAVIGQAAYDDYGWEKLLVAVDARMQEVYFAAYQANINGLVELCGKEIISPPQDIIFPDVRDWYGVGNGWNIYSNNFNFQPVKRDDEKSPRATALLKLARHKFLKKDFIEPHEVIPVYLRDKVTN